MTWNASNIEATTVLELRLWTETPSSRRALAESASSTTLKFTEMEGYIGVGHTRWATHGGLTEENSHPHWSCRADVVIVHNGIIENYAKLKEFLEDRGHKFLSQTDTEIVAHLLEEAIVNHVNLKRAIMNVVNSRKGSYAFLAMLREQPQLLIAVRKDAPLVLGIASGSCFVSSDDLSFIDKTNQAIFLDNKEIAFVRKDKIRVLMLSKKELQQFSKLFGLG